MKDSKILIVFVGIAVSLWLLIALAVFFLPKIGYGNFLELVFKAHPTIILLAAFPLISTYMKTTEEPMPYKRALRISGKSLVLLLPLYVLSESINANALVATLGISDLMQEGERNYVVFTYQGLALTAFGALAGLGFVFPAQVKVRQKQASTKTV
ncbi:hypothetical protein [Pseudophaeobacter sp. EL27]|uniref:hypothetical protein n=1 Tax=Pseudophaeobacter sp. EL27 TaxID=2107580 RepID=UPI000EFBBBCA|nr:hypothetical protein [Pseudophaeobacter sp. EL27]